MLLPPSGSVSISEQFYIFIFTSWILGLYLDNRLRHLALRAWRKGYCFAVYVTTKYVSLSLRFFKAQERNDLLLGLYQRIHGCETWDFTVRKQERLLIFENKCCEKFRGHLKMHPGRSIERSSSSEDVTAGCRWTISEFKTPRNFAGKEM